jgi:hypothetical protein
VDDGDRLVHIVHSAVGTAPAAPHTHEAPVPRGDEGLEDLPLGDPPQEGPDRQRQRIDMISPTTMTPKPMAKFQADSDTMNGIRSPAT